MKISKEEFNPAELAKFDLDNFEEEIRMDEPAWTEAGANGYCVLYVARDEHGNIAANIVIKTALFDTGVWYFYSVAVADKHRRMGLARRLFYEAINSENATGVINSHTHVTNEASIALHKSLGFKAIQYVPDFYGECEDAILWQRMR